jgi:hypothetical protein
MTPEVKANELVNKYLDIDSKYEYLSYLMAKQCALIAVDEMLDFRNGLYINEGSLAHQWLLDVKHEIQKL